MTDASEYRCDSCGETFISDWSNEEAKAEAETTFTPDELVDTAVVCDDCWQEMRKAMPDLDARYQRVIESATLVGTDQQGNPALRDVRLAGESET